MWEDMKEYVGKPLADILNVDKNKQEEDLNLWTRIIVILILTCLIIFFGVYIMYSLEIEEELARKRELERMGERPDIDE